MKTSTPNTTGGTNPTSMLRSTVRAIEPYVPILPFEVLADRLERPIEEIIKLDANENFSVWLKDFKKVAVKKGISKETVNEVMDNAKFLSKVIEYDRYQPEFYEDTYTYIKKRTGKDKLKKGLSLYRKEKNILSQIDMRQKVLSYRFDEHIIKKIRL